MKNNNIALEGGRVSWMTVTKINYYSANNNYKKYERKVGESSFTCSLFDGDKWVTDKRKINWYNVYQKVEEDKKDPRYNKEFRIEIK